MVCTAPQKPGMSEVRAKEFETVELAEEQPDGDITSIMYHEDDGMADKEAVRVHKELQELSEELEKMLDPKNPLSTPPPAVAMSPLECHALQLEEVEALAAIYGEDFTLLSDDDPSCFCVRIKFLSDVIVDKDVIRIWFSLPSSYPAVPPVFEIEANKSGTFTFSNADRLYQLLEETSLAKIGSTAIFDLISLAQEELAELISRKDQDMSVQEGVHTDVTGSDFPANVLSVDGDDPVPAVVMMRHYRPQHFLGSVHDLITNLPPTLKLIRLENILRDDLAQRFVDCQERATRDLWKKERQNPHLYSLKPQVAFHGTLSRSFPSIVQHGLVVPGSGNKVGIRSGASYGVGIYLSPHADYSMSYADSSRLIVCAVLHGLRYIEGGKCIREHSRCHVVISSCGNEWVFFNASQVLPCYVIEVKARPHTSGFKRGSPSLTTNTLPDSQKQVEEEKEAERQARLQARARKFLPYGFGPGKMVILDAAEFDDDEEEYGDYQLLRQTGYGSDSHPEYQRGVQNIHTELQHYREVDRPEDVPSN